LAAGDSQHRLFSDHFGPFLIFLRLRWFVFPCSLFLVFFFVSQKRIKGLRLLIAFRAVFTGRIHIGQFAAAGGLGLDGVYNLWVRLEEQLYSCFYPVAKAAEDDGFNRLERHKIMGKAQSDSTCLVEALELFRG
jgi:hypothetical protein